MAVMKSISQRRKNNKILKARIERLCSELKPLVQLPAGEAHHDYPKTLFAYHLLTEAQLDDMAHYYHQSTPGPFSQMYPTPMRWDKDFLANIPDEEEATTLPRSDVEEGEIVEAGGIVEEEPQHYVWPLPRRQRIAIKKRKFGNFIGLTGCETPTEEIDFFMEFRFEQIREGTRLELERNEGDKHFRGRFH